MIEWWQHLPLVLDPIAFSIGSFSLRWYSLFWLFGIFFSFLVFLFFTSPLRGNQSTGFFVDIFLWGVFGALVGGRLGFALLYQPEYLLSHPMNIVFPTQVDGSFEGYFGMSFFGGLFGAFVFLFFFLRSRKGEFFEIFDALALSAPIGIFFGRIGNFFNGELIGRITDVPWGMYFLSFSSLRHPSQLYEALLEGILLFFTLLFFQRNGRFQGSLPFLFLIFYSFYRFIAEFFREPDPWVGLFFGFFTISQLYCLGVFFLAFIFLRFQKNAILERV